MDGNRTLVIGSKRYRAVPRKRPWWQFGRGEVEVDWVLEVTDKAAEARAWRKLRK